MQARQRTLAGGGRAPPDDATQQAPTATCELSAQTECLTSLVAEGGALSLGHIDWRHQDAAEHCKSTVSSFVVRTVSKSRVNVAAKLYNSSSSSSSSKSLLINTTPAKRRVAGGSRARTEQTSPGPGGENCLVGPTGRAHDLTCQQSGVRPPRPAMERSTPIPRPFHHSIEITAYGMRPTAPLQSCSRPSPP